MLWWTLRRLKSGNWRTRMRAAEKLCRYGDPSVVDPLISTLQDPDINVRAAAAEALGIIREPKAVNPLLKALADAGHPVRSAAARALGEIASAAIQKKIEIPDSQVVESLTPLLKDENTDVQSAALAALQLLSWKPEDESQQLLVDQIQARWKEEEAARKRIEAERQLIAAAASHQVGKVRELIEAGVDVNATDSNGMTALMAAAQAVRPDMATLGFTRQGVLDGSYLDEARKEQRKAVQDTLQLLMKAGADVNVLTNDGWTPLAVSARNNYIDSLRALIEGGADVNMKNEAGRTALIAAVVATSLESVEALVETGADVNLPDARGFTPTDYANELFLKAGFSTMVRRNEVLSFLRFKGGY
jgi:uncharacterized protein